MDDLIDYAKRIAEAEAQMQNERHPYKRIHAEETPYGSLVLKVTQLRETIERMTRLAEHGGDLRDICMLGKLALGQIRELSDEENQIMREALGLDIASKPCRKYLIASINDKDKTKRMDEMVRAGLLRCPQPGMGIYTVTEVGAMMMGHRLPDSWTQNP